MKEGDSMASSYSGPLLALLRRGGWFEGRTSSEFLIGAPHLDLFPKAEEVLREFGGLHLGECGPGIECATSDVEIDPNLTVHLASDLAQFAASKKLKLYPLAEVHRGHGFLIIDEHGRVYLLSDDLVPFAPTFGQGLELLLLGKKPSAEW
jgi:hypothetical protein